MAGSVVKYWYDVNGNRIRKQEGSLDEVYVLGINGETEAVFGVNGVIKFFNVNAGSEIIGRFIPAPPVDLYLTNTTLSGTYEAQNSITVENNVTVTGPTVLKAGNSIRLKPGFSTGSGNDFTAKIGAITNSAKRFYYLKDHLGSIRVVVNETGDIVSSDDYDPWGMILDGRSTNNAYLNAKYKFTGKERDVETGYDYFGARYYDSRIGRWMQVDPLAEKYFGWSPYTYSLNNPLRFIDSDGKQSTEWLKVLFKAVVRVLVEPIKNEALDEILDRNENKDMLGERPIGSEGEDIDEDRIDDSKDGIDNRYYFKEMTEFKKVEDKMNDAFRKSVEEGIKLEKQKQWNTLIEQSKITQSVESENFELEYIDSNESFGPIKLNEDDVEDIK